MSFWEYDLAAEALHIGERIKKGTFRPLVPPFSDNGRRYRAIPYSTAVGALRELLGLNWDTAVHAAGYLTEGEVEELAIAPRDNATGVAKLPITLQYASKAKGKLFVLLDEHTEGLSSQFSMFMGGMRYKGFGQCWMKRVSEEPLEPRKKKGALLTRIPEDALLFFGADPKILDGDGFFRRGYLFKPTSPFGGAYVRSVFERSIVEAFDFLVGDNYEVR